MDNINKYKNAPDAMYIYDRICPKSMKAEEMFRLYGTERYSSAKEKNIGRERVYGKAFAENQLARYREYCEAHPYTEIRKNSGSGRIKRGYAARGEDRKEYIYRPNRMSGVGAGSSAAAKEKSKRPFKMILDGVVNFFESLEERRERDERIAKGRAVAGKKFSEYKHALITALLLVAVTLVFALLVFKLFFVIKNIDVSGSEIYSENEIAEAAGFEIGDSLYSFNAENAEENIMFLCPYIKSAQITRIMPKTVIIDATDDTPAYYVNVYGDYLKLSSGLRVLEKTSKEEAESEGLTYLILPEVSYSVAGRTLSFTNQRDERFIRNVLSGIETSVFGETGDINEVNLSDEYNISLICSEKYDLYLGEESDVDLKLRMAYNTVNNEEFDKTSYAKIDLSVVGQASVRYENAGSK